MKLRNSLQLFLLAITAHSSYTSCLAQSVGHQKQDPPILFLENKGQVLDFENQPRPDILFMMRASGVGVFVGKGELHYLFSRPIPRATETGGLKRATISDPELLSGTLGESTEPKPTEFETYRIDIKLKGMNPDVRIETAEPDAYYENYYNIPGHYEEGILNVRSYGKLVFKNVYPNIDWVLYSKGGKLKHEFVLHPGADFRNIVMEVNGASDLSVEATGELKLISPLSEIIEDKPFIPENPEMECHFISHQVSDLQYELKYNIPGITEMKDQLTIDPGVVWSTFYGGSYDETGVGVVFDDSNNIYFSGNTASANNIFYKGFQDTLRNSLDLYLSKTDSAGKLEWSTYIGGTSTEDCRSLSVGSGYVMVTGYTYSKGLGYKGHLNTKPSTNLEQGLFILFNSKGNRIWSSYYGSQVGRTVVFDGKISNNRVIIAGMTQSTSDIGTTGTHQSSFVGSDEGFIGYFDLNCNRIWGSYLGGSVVDEIRKIEVSGNGVFYSGFTNSTTGVVKNGFQSQLGGLNDGLIGKFDTLGLLEWSSYIGGSSDDYYSDVTIHDTMVYFSGMTNSSNGISFGNCYQGTFGGGSFYDGCITKVSSKGKRIWSTYFGTIGDEQIKSIRADIKGQLWLITYSVGSIPKTKNGIYDNSKNYPGVMNLMLSIFDTSMALKYSTMYFGTSSNKLLPSCLATNNYGRAMYISEVDFNADPAIRAPISTWNNGYDDAFLVMWTPTSFNQPAVLSPQPICQGYKLNYTYSQWAVGRGKTPKTYIQISDTNGVFNSNAQTIYTRNDSLSRIDTLLWTIPQNMPPGKNYRIRAIMSFPSDTSKASEPFEILRSPTGQILAVNSNQICNNDSLKLEVDTLGSNKLRWYRIASPTPNPGDTTKIYYAKLAGKHYALLTAPNGCTNATNSISLIVWQRPYAGFVAGDTQSCFKSQNFSFLDTSKAAAGDVITQKMWYFGDGQSTGFTNPTYTYNQPGNYLLKLGIGTQRGCRDTAYQMIHVWNEPVARIHVNQAEQCFRGNAFEFTDSTTILQDYISGRIWKQGTVTLDTGNVLKKSYASTGIFDVSLYVQSSHGCQHDTSMDIRVNSSPVATIQASKPGFCAGDSVQLKVTDPNSYSYTWYVNGSDISEFRTQWYTRQAGAYKVKAVTSKGCDTFSNTVSITAYLSPEPDLGPDKTLHNDSSIMLDAGIYNTYTWFDNDINRSRTFDKSNLDTGGNVLWVMVTDSNGCKGSDTIEIRLNAKQTDGLIKLNEIGIKVYPIPVTDELILDCAEKPSAGSIILFDASGKKIYSGSFSGTTRIDMSRYANGHYQLMVILEQQEIVIPVIKR